MVIRHAGAGSTTSVLTTAIESSTTESVSGRSVTLGVTVTIAALSDYAP